MSAVTPLVDTLLATRLGQRVDLVPLKAQAEIAGPGAVAGVEQVDNDIRLPSREALQRELGVGAAGRGGVPASPAHAGAEGAVILSAAARTVSALLKLPAGSTPAVRGLAPLQPELRAPLVPVLAATLARTVAESGLFYESHLQQYAAGQRTLAQLAREPQAGLALPPAAAQPPDVGLSPAPASAAGALASLAVLLEGVAALPPVPASSSTPPAAGPVVPAQHVDSAVPEAATASPPAPTGPATSYGANGLPEPAPPGPHDFSLADAGAPASTATPGDGARAGQPMAAIHPEAVGLVRQQLELLAQPVFRWSGEGWPGIPMDWEIRQEGRQEGEGQEADAGREGREGREGPPAPAAWVSRMTLELPRLGTVDVRLGLSGAALQLRLDASRAGTAAVLDQAGAQLSRRLGALGLELAELRIAGAAHPATGSAGLAGGGGAG